MGRQQLVRLPPCQQHNAGGAGSQGRRGRWLPGPAVSLRHTLSEIDGHLGVDQTPVLAASGPFFGNVHHGQIQHFQQAVIGGEHGFGFGHLAQLAVEALDGLVV